MPSNKRAAQGSSESLNGLACAAKKFIGTSVRRSKHKGMSRAKKSASRLINNARCAARPDIKRFILTRGHEIRNPLGQIFQHYEESILLGLYTWCDRPCRARRRNPDVIEHVANWRQFHLELFGKRDSGPERATWRLLHHLRFRQFPRGIEHTTSGLDVFFVAYRHDSI